MEPARSKMPNEGMNVRGPSNDEYETPPWLFEACHTEFGFEWDAAARKTDMEVEQSDGTILKMVGGNALAGLVSNDIEKDIKMIRAHRGNVWCNPPYSKIDLFIGLALMSPNLWCFLLPSRTGTGWFQRLRWSFDRVEMRPFRRRIQFLLNGQPPLGKDGKPQGPRFDSMIAIVRPR
jgi:hypothetical protein